MKFKRLVPLTLALVIASTTAAEAAHLQQNRFSFVVRPNYTQTVSRPLASKPSQSTAANQLRRAGGLAGKRRTCQTGTARADHQHHGAAGGADPRRRTANQLFAHAPERRILLYRADRGRRFLRACRRKHRLWSEHAGGCCAVVDELVRPPREYSQQQLHHNRRRLYRCERNRILGTAFHRIMDFFNKQNRPHLRSVLLYPAVYHESEYTSPLMVTDCTLSRSNARASTAISVSIRSVSSVELKP